MKRFFLSLLVILMLSPLSANWFGSLYFSTWVKGSSDCALSVSNVPSSKKCSVSNIKQIKRGPNFEKGKNKCKADITCHDSVQNYDVKENVTYNTGQKIPYPFDYSDVGCFKHCVSFNQISKAEQAK